MLTRLSFGLDENNRPIIEVKLQQSDDLRDKVANQFIETIGHRSNICSIHCDLVESSARLGASTKNYTIRPVSKLFIPYQELDEDTDYSFLITEDLIEKTITTLIQLADTSGKSEIVNSLASELDAVRGYTQSAPYIQKKDSSK